MTSGGFDLNLLPALNALLEERNVTRAAWQLSLGQPAMSAALARLRRHFDDPLLIRDGRGFVLSPFAESLRDAAQQAVIAAAVASSAKRSFDPLTDSRTFTVATSDYAALVFLRPLLGGLGAEAPGVRLRLVPIAANLDDALRSGRLDIVLLPVELAQQLRGLPRKALFDDRFVLVADVNNAALAAISSCNDGAAARDKADMRQWIQTLPFAAVVGDMPSLIEQRLREQDVTLRVDVTTEAFVIAPLLTAGTPLVSIVQERLARLAAEQSKLRMHPCPVDIGTFTEAMYWSLRSEDDPGHRWLRSRLIAQAQQM